ncbi:hypothetical protein QUF80_04640 [Desulfococcaceae bacterium HSG8]|nr:hypothetical protein [Desulfococcaceae bacterium HSG8]
MQAKLRFAWQTEFAARGVRICQSEPSGRGPSERQMIHAARGGLANPRGFGFVNPNRAGEAIRAADDPCCSRGIGKSPRVRICQSEPSGRRPSERQMIHAARGGLANPPPAGFGFVNPNRAGEGHPSGR